jgi:hypothetical protein
MSPTHQRFFDPIKSPGRKPLVTLRDAAEFISELLEAEHELLPDWLVMIVARGTVL